MPRRARNNDLADADFARHCRRMQRSGAAIGNEREVAGIETAFGRDAFHRVGHLGRRDAQDAVGGVRRWSGRSGWPHARHGLLRGRDIELHFAAEEAVGAQPAQQTDWRR